MATESQKLDQCMTVASYECSLSSQIDETSQWKVQDNKKADLITKLFGWRSVNF